MDPVTPFGVENFEKMLQGGGGIQFEIPPLKRSSTGMVFPLGTCRTIIIERAKLRVLHSQGVVRRESGGEQKRLFALVAKRAE